MGVLSYILPYMEQDNIYKQIPLDQFNNKTFLTAWAYGYPPVSGDGNQTAALGVANNVIKTYLCPSDNAQDVQLTGGIFDGGMWYDPSFGAVADYVYDTPGFGHEFGRTNYFGVGGVLPKGYPIPSEPGGTRNRYLGVYGTGTLAGTYSSPASKHADITDGTSVTLAFGESLGGGAITRDFVFSWMGGGAMYTDWGLANLGVGVDFQWYQFSSKHPGQVNFAFADGSVHGFNKNGNTRKGSVLWLMSGRADGELPNGDY
jgi:prepilin-type processing-associated H-X9-DG protein